jgi:hypothetical protein
MPGQAAKIETDLTVLKWMTRDMTEQCGNCRFFLDAMRREDGSIDRDRESMCRRRSPRRQSFMFTTVELLQEITHALNAIANVQADEYDAVNTEMTEAWDKNVWPHVHEYDWCGEYQRADHKREASDQEDTTT